MEKPEIILSAALKLFVEYGFHGTPTSKIASEAGVSQGILFHYFKTKDGLVMALYIRVKESLNNYLAERTGGAGNGKEKFRKLFVCSVEWALKNKDEFYFSQQFHYSPHLKGVAAEEIVKQNRITRELMQDAIKTKLFKPLPVDLISSLSASQIIGVYNYLVSADLSAAKQTKVINEGFELVWGMLATPV